MDRRTFVLAAGAVPLWLSQALAQTSRPAIGLLASGSPETFATVVTGFREGLSAAGLAEGRNVAIEYRWAQGQFDRLPSLAAELVQHQVGVIVTMGGNVSALAAKRATSAIPIVFLTADDPVSSGLVDSLSRPGGNVTGVTWLAAELGAKNLELASELLPNAATIGVLVNPNRPTAEAQLESARSAAKAIGKTVLAFKAGNRDDIDKVFADIGPAHVDALFVTVDPVFIVNRVQIIESAAKQRVPTLYFQREFVDLGGLLSYGASAQDASRLVGGYAARILKGARPADLPVQRSTKIETIVNLRTARALGITIPPTLLARADEVID
ncbi:ABC transporter substrate-binding protein [Bradyrhizobium sp. Y36]|uniref:ABC transporter substrate-binding protein n=1 Tax=Bradyrhizobium sp. Y36 TaxID=2035447 RepID=UPI000BE7C190|nr:ABC transporter substrate-binding protein [Bradyrhizobium sp. Y36]PDT86131.1 ABC transporter substrate-binding protein [Bradyrhizobium sp. Y36]